jgi:hypothetical protein
MPQQKKESDDRPQEDGPFSMPDIDRSTSRPTDSSTRSSGEESTSRNVEESKEEPDEKSKLKQHMDLVVESPASPIESKPSMSVKPNCYVSEDVEETLRKVVNVLETRYGKDFSKSLVVDYALRTVLLDAFHNAEESQLVRWLDDTIE